MSTTFKQRDLEGSAKRATKIGSVKMLPVPVLAWKLVYSRLFFQPPEYNLNEIGRIEDVESYVRQALRKKNGLMFKAGFSLTGPNPKTIKYIQTRFSQIEQAQGKPMDILLREIGSDILKYHNAYLVKVRIGSASGGLKRRDARWGKTLQPVAAYFRMSPEMVHIKRDIFGNVLQYRQQTYTGFKRLFFDPEDVIHFYIDRKGGFSVGTPSLVPVMDDIRALRRLEENVELLVYQHLFPLMHYKVGTEENPAQTYPDGTTEIDKVRIQLEMMPSEGSIVTPERHDISILGSQGRALRVDWYLEHFRNRVFAGLGMSAMDFGEAGGANRSTAERLSRSLIGDVKDYQCHVAAFINYEMIRELLLESTWGIEAVEDENIVNFVFAEIDEDAKVKREANALNMYQGHLLTEDEARQDMGRMPITDDQRKNMFFELVDKPKAIIQAIDEPFTGKSASSTTSVPASTAKKSPSPAGRAAANKVQPTNQHGKKPGPNRRLSQEDPQSALMEVFSSVFDKEKERKNNDLDSDYGKSTVNLYTIYLSNVTATISRDGKLDQDWMRQLSHVTSGRLNKEYDTILKNSFMSGIGNKSYRNNPKILVAFEDLKRNCEKHIGQMLNNAERAISKAFHKSSDLHERQLYLNSLVGSLEYRARFFHDIIVRRAYLWGKANSLALDGHTLLEVVNDPIEAGCADCTTKHAYLIDVRSMDIRDLPPYHSSCICDIQPQQE